MYIHTYIFRKTKNFNLFYELISCDLEGFSNAGSEASDAIHMWMVFITIKPSFILGKRSGYAALLSLYTNIERAYYGCLPAISGN